MTGSSDSDDADGGRSSGRPGEAAEPEEDPLPGEDNPGERLISKYDPTVDADGESKRDIVGADVPEHLTQTFWFLVAVFNVAVFALAFGVMLIAFEGNWSLGGQITAAGAILFAYGYYRYRKYLAGRGGD